MSVSPAARGGGHAGLLVKYTAEMLFAVMQALCDVIQMNRLIDVNGDVVDNGAYEGCYGKSAENQRFV